MQTTDSILFNVVISLKLFYDQIVMESSNLKDPYDNESDDEDSEVDDVLNDEFEEG